ncbi:EG19 antigen [Echinococcus multilocularis]|uniref:EG19 antigen n=1 Tax=Echinococcus multilocularis TaxID=6211 RepID=A0A068XVT5_ECHMU|nr:EG19 antigen [Echinococcus multilocularis]
MRTQLLLLLTFCSLLVLFVQAEAKCLHRPHQRVVKEGEVSKGDEVDGEDRDDESVGGDEGRPLLREVPYEGKQESEAKDADKIAIEGVVRKVAHLGTGKSQHADEKALFDEEEAENEDESDEIEDDDGYYKIDKKTMDSFCNQMKRYWREVGHGIRDEWCKLRSMFPNI